VGNEAHDALRAVRGTTYTVGTASNVLCKSTFYIINSSKTEFFFFFSIVKRKKKVNLLIFFLEI
jgi:hypothetical protein